MVGVLSFLLLSGGIVTFTLGIVVVNTVRIDNEWTQLPPTDNPGLGSLMVIFGFLTFFVGVLGIYSYRMRMRKYVIRFIIAAAITGSVLVTVGKLLFQGGHLNSDVIEMLCKGADNWKGPEQNNLNVEYNKAVQNYVCSEQCPCWTGLDNMYVKLVSNVSEPVLNSWNRTMDLNSTNPDYSPIVFREAKNQSFHSWKDCYERVLKNQIAKGSPELRHVKEYIDKGGYAFMRQAEDRFRCAGMCQIGIFFPTYGLSVHGGLP